MKSEYLSKNLVGYLTDATKCQINISYYSTNIVTTFASK